MHPQTPNSSWDILEEIAALRIAIDKRFDAVDEKLDKYDERIRETEKRITVVNTIGLAIGAVLTFFGWDKLHTWLKS